VLDEGVPDGVYVGGEAVRVLGLVGDDLLEGVEEEVLALGVGVDLVEDEGDVLGEVADSEVAEGVGGSRFDLFDGGGEGVEDDELELGVVVELDVLAGLAEAEQG